MARIAIQATFVASLCAAVTANPIQGRQAWNPFAPVANHSTAVSLKAPVSGDFHGCWTIPTIVGGVPLDLCFDTTTSQSYLDVSEQNVTSKWTATPAGDFNDNNLGVVVSGLNYKTTVNISTLTVTQQAIGVTNASLCFGCSDGEGLLGFGHYSTLMTNLIGEGQIPGKNIIGFSLPDPAKGTSGELTIGGFNSKQFSGELQYATAMDAESDQKTWSIFVEDVSYGDKSYTSNDPYEAIIDTRDTATSLPFDVYIRFITDAGFTGPNESSATKPTANMTFNMGGTKIVLTPDQYAVESNGTWTTWLGNGGIANFRLGQKFMQHYYIVLDASSGGSPQVGFGLIA